MAEKTFRVKKGLDVEGPDKDASIINGVLTLGTIGNISGASSSILALNSLGSVNINLDTNTNDTNSNFVITEGGVTKFTVGNDGGVTLTNDMTIPQQKYINFDSTDTRIGADASNPENLLITADANIQLNPDDDIVIKVGTTEYVRFDGSTQRLGIGTDTPTYKLHVAGSGYFTDDLRVGAETPTKIALNGNDAFVQGQFEAAGTAGSYIYSLALGTASPTASSAGKFETSGDVKAGSMTIGGHTFDDIDIGTEFVDADSHIMSSGAIKEKIESYNYLASVDISANTNLAVSSPITLTGDTVGLADPATLSQLTESTDATDDKILLWDETASSWKYMTLDNLQDSIDTTASGGASVLNGLTDVLISNDSIFINNFGSAPTTGSLSTASDNVAIGHNALDAIATGDYHVAIGSGAGGSVSGDDSSVFIGKNAGLNATPTAAVIIGKEAGESATTVDTSIMVGYQAGASSTGQHTVLAGWKAGKFAGADYGIGIGRRALEGSSTVGDNDGEDNIAVGNAAMLSITGGSSNISVGASAAEGLTTGTHNIAIGKETMKSVHTGIDRNITLGNEAGYYIGNNDNVAIGYRALKGSSTASANSGQKNIAIGYTAMESYTTGEDNVAIGRNALGDITTGDNNIAIGEGASSTTDVAAGNNIMMGYFAGAKLKGGVNVGIGSNAVHGSATVSNNTGTYNVGIGNFNLSVITSGDDNIGLGQLALRNVSSGNQNIGIGHDAGTAITTGSGNILIGKDSGDSIVDGSFNVLIGEDAGQDITSGSRNLILHSGNNAANAPLSATADEQLRISSDDKIWLAGYDGNLYLGRNHLQKLPSSGEDTSGTTLEIGGGAGTGQGAGGDLKLQYAPAAGSTNSNVNSHADALTVHGDTGNVTIHNNLIVSGDSITVNAETITTEEAMLSMGIGQTATDADALDFGFYGTYDVGDTQKFRGVFADASDSGKFKFFKDLQAEPTTAVNTGGTGYAAATVVAATFEGNLTGNATGSHAGTLAGNASTATTATNVVVSANNSGNENIFPVFVDGATGTQGIETDTGFTYNPSTGMLTATGFTGALTGNADTATSATSATTAAGLSSTLAVSSGGTGATTLTSNAVLTGNGTSAVQAESNFTYDGATLTVKGNDGVTALTDDPIVLVRPILTNSRSAALTIQGARNGSTTANAATLLLSNEDDNLSDANQFNHLGAIVGRVSDITDNHGDMHFLTFSDGATANDTMTLTGTGKVGIGTTTAPHGGVGYAKFAIEGTNGNAAGPHVQYTTASNDYPLFQQLNWQHDNIAMSFDAYYDGSWRSSDPGSNYQFYKIGDTFKLQYDSGIAAGSTVTWNEGITLDTSGNVTIPNGSLTIGSSTLTLDGSSNKITGLSDIEPAAASGSDTAGTDLIVSGGNSTGAGAGGDILFKTAPAGSSSSNANTLTERMRIHDTGDTEVKGNLTGRIANGVGSNLYRFGGLYLTWDADNYGTNLNHSITSTENGTFADSLTINSYDKIRLNMDTNSNNSDSFIQFGRHTTGTGGDTFMTIADGGNVGIGTTAPSNKLHLALSMADGDDGILLTRTDSSTSQNDILGGIGFDSSDGNIPSSVLEASVAIVGRARENHSTGDKGGYLDFYYAPTDQDDDTTSRRGMRMMQGKLAVGGQNSDVGDPINSLVVYHAGSDWHNGLLVLRDDVSISSGDLLGAIGFDGKDGNNPSNILEASAGIAAYAAEDHSTGDKGGDLAFFTSAIDDDDDTTSHERMRITSAGNVGIGTTSPAVNLHVANATDPKIRVQDTTGNYSATLSGYSGGAYLGMGDMDSGESNWLLFGAFSSINNLQTRNRDFHLYGTNTTTGFYFDESAGHFGIGTTSPRSQLDVRGAAGSPGHLSLSTAETTVADGDILGRIDFIAPLEADGVGDSTALAAAIYAEADDTFSDTVNKTDIVFATGSSEAATEKMRLLSTGQIELSGTTVGSPADNTHVRLGFESEVLRIDSNDGYLQIGAQNSTYMHMVTDRGKFYFNRELIVNEGIVSSYDENLRLQRVNTTADQIEIAEDIQAFTVGSTAVMAITNPTGETNPQVTIGGSLTLQERAAAPDDNAGYGQLWVKSDGDGELYFTDDNGTDIQLTDDGAATGSGGGGAVSAVANGANNRIATFSSASALNGESALTWDGGTLNITSEDTVTEAIKVTIADTDSTADSTPFVVDGNGRVGIGTASPLTDMALTLNGDGTSYEGIAFQVGGANRWKLQSDSSAFYFDSQVNTLDYNLRLRDSSGAYNTMNLNADTAGTIKMGLGVSPVPLLHVKANNSTTSQTTAGVASITIEQDGTGDAALNFLLTSLQRWMVGIDNSDSDKFKIETGATSLGSGAALTIATNGDMGINQTSPAALLHIKGSENSWDKHIRLENHDTTDYGAILVDSAGMKFRTFTNGHDFYFRDNDNNTLLQIQDGGAIKFNNAYTFPTSDGSANQVLTTNGSGVLTFANAGGGSSTDSFMIFGEESDDYLGPASAGNSNGFSFSYGNGAQNTTKSSSGADFGMPLGCDCTLKALYIHFGNKNSRTSSTNMSIDIFKNQSGLDDPMTGNASGSGGNAFVMSKTNYDIDFDEGDTFNIRVESPTSYSTATQIGPARFTAYFERR